VLVAIAAGWYGAAAFAADGYWELQKTEFRNEAGEGVREWLAQGHQIQILENSEKKLRIRDIAPRRSYKQTYDVAWLMPRYMIPGKEPAIEFSAMCIEALNDESWAFPWYIPRIQMASNLNPAQQYCTGSNCRGVDLPCRPGEAHRGSAEGEPLAVSAGEPGDTVHLELMLAPEGGAMLRQIGTYVWVEGTVPDGQPKAGAPATAALYSGRWKSTEGDMTLQQTNGSVIGSYSQDGGRLEGEATGPRLKGYWAENSSDRRCDSQRLGSWYWGRLDFSLSDDGSRFSGAWSYCDAPPARSWTGARLP
jgi:hypothetical protein